MGSERSGLKIAIWVLGFAALAGVMGALVFVRPKPSPQASQQAKATLSRELERSERRVQQLTDEVKQLRARIDSVEVTAAEAARLARSSPTTAVAPVVSTGSYQSAPAAARAQDDEGGFPAGASWARSEAQRGAVVIGKLPPPVSLSKTHAPGKEDRLPKPVAKLAQAADLDAQQAAKLSEVLAKERKKTQYVMRKARKRGDIEGAQQSVEKIRKRTNASMHGVLSDDQYARYAKMKKRLDSRAPKAKSR